MADMIDRIPETAEIRRLNSWWSVNLYDCCNLVVSVPGTTYRPLELKSDSGEKSQLTRFREEAKRGSPFEEAIGLTLPDSGLRADAMAHMTEDWLDWAGDTLRIDVPAYEKCTLGSGDDGRGGDRTDTGVPCWYCKNRSLKDFLPSPHKLPDSGDCWSAKSEAGYKGRLIPIKEDDTQQAIATYFKVYDRIGSQDQVRSAVIRIAERADILEVTVDEDGNKEYWPTPHDLRDTYGTRLAYKGFSRDDIKSVMGHTSIQQADDYVKMSGVEAAQAFDDKW